MSSFFALVAFCALPLVLADAIHVSVPSTPPSNHIVQPNFLGISFELSFVSEYFGNDTTTIPQPFVNYLSTLRNRIGNQPLRMRLGGNSMDDSLYVPTQTTPMLQLISGDFNFDDQPVHYGPVLWDVLATVATNIGGAAYLIGHDFLGSATQRLGDSLDGFLLGNEPDLYTAHGNRPHIKNYTTAIYIDEFRTSSDHLTNTTAGNILSKHDLGGPTICCDWNLDALLDDGYTSAFGDILKYISLQHYPQNNCFGFNKYKISYYVQHSNVVELASWQGAGVKKVVSNRINNQQLIMSEFNSASCGGIPGLSDTFAVGSLWTIDYALQLASVGYSAAYLHTRERGISYNLFTPPPGPNGAPGLWTTNPPFYSLLVTAEALRSQNGSIVSDLNINGSRTNPNVKYSGYAVYDAGDSTVQQLVFFNFANVSSSLNSTALFDVPSGVFNATSGKNVVVKYLVGNSMQEKKNIAWGGQTFANAGNGELVSAGNASWAVPDAQLDCTNGCTVQVPAPGMAVVFAGGLPPKTSSTSTTLLSTSSTPSTSATADVNTSSAAVRLTSVPSRIFPIIVSIVVTIIVATL
ncbi:hypothetical protein JR316_0004681 [Psilocybe cubensis]|uniref:Beta-glucuronidase C-terminal domain-containing protein n=2 Tax=Psilocybe cubensis TaxID=181762 RepID=A0A8H7Y197_PSICU|nr:hypothetical protein JR316_0004681 [Psilocybe cubensis]KAH9482581.1 hypothetical protein JR316_0004681 [Psilocybe cubensis]